MLFSSLLILLWNNEGVFALATQEVSQREQACPNQGTGDSPPEFPVRWDMLPNTLPELNGINEDNTYSISFMYTDENYSWCIQMKIAYELERLVKNKQTKKSSVNTVNTPYFTRTICISYSVNIP